MAKKHITIKFLHNSLQSYFAADWLYQTNEPDWLRRLDEKVQSYHTWQESMYLMSGLLSKAELNQLIDWCFDWRDNLYGLAHLPEHLFEIERFSELFGLLGKPFLTAKLNRTASYSSLLQDIDLAFSAAIQVQDDYELLRACLLYNLIKRHLDAQAYTGLIVAEAARGNIESALREARAIIGVPAKVLQLCLIAEFLLRKGDSTSIQKGLQTLDEMFALEVEGAWKFTQEANDQLIQFATRYVFPVDKERAFRFKEVVDSDQHDWLYVALGFALKAEKAQLKRNTTPFEHEEEISEKLRKNDDYTAILMDSPL